MLKRNKFMLRMKRISKNDPIFATGNRAVHDKLTFWHDISCCSSKEKKSKQ